MAVRGDAERWRAWADKTTTGVGAARSPTRGGGVGFGPKPRNRAVMARFQACRVKRRYGAMQRGGGHGLIRQRQGWGLRVRQCEAGGGFGPKTRNRAVVARFWACRLKRRYGMMARGGGDPLLR